MATRLIVAGFSALRTYCDGSSSYWTMSIFSPRSSRITACTREPFMPTQAPTGSTSRSFERTATLLRSPASRDDADDADRAVVDLGDFHLEQLLDQQLAGPREHQLRSLALPLDVDQHGADPVARVVVLGAGLLAARDHALGASQVDDHVAAVEPLDLAGEQLADRGRRTRARSARARLP